MTDDFRERRIAPIGPLTALVVAALVVLVLVNETVHAQDDPTDRQPAEPLLSIELRSSHLGYTFFHAGGTRYFVTEIELTNRSGRDVTMPMFPIEFLFDGVAYRPDIEHPKLLGYEFRAGGKSYRFSNLPQTKVLPLSPGATGSAWLVYTGLPKTPDIPEMELRFGLEGVAHTFDIDAHYDAQLALEVERIGPRGALGLLTIDGTLNTINVGTLVDVLDQLSTARVSRAVVSFGDAAADVDESLANWLRQRADGNQTTRNDPIIVSTIREFHVAAIPAGASSGRSSAHDHESTAAAVEAALATAYRGIPPEEVVQQIEQGHRFAQASALANGGGELPIAYLPLLLDRAASDDRLLRRAAMIALSGLGDPAATDALGHSAQSDDEQTATIAVECLAASRYVTAHDTLAGLLDEPLSVPEVDLVRILARHPRPQWSAYLSRLARDAQQTTTPAVRQAVLLALGQMGHPELTDILRGALQSSEEGIRETAFQLLLSRDDDASEQIAIEYALGRLDSDPPSPQMLQLFDRVRDPRVTPRLIVHLDDDQSDRSGLITTLARIGSADIDQELADRYETLKPNEQAVVLTNLTQLRSARLLPLAHAGLRSEHDKVFIAATQSLSLVADAKSVTVLAAQLGNEQNQSRVDSLARALEQIGTHQATRALEVARNNSRDDKRVTIAKHLLSLRRKSPGGQHLKRADAYAGQSEHEKAIEHYTLALERDPELAPAYSGRGYCRLKLEQFKEAEEDFRRGLKLDPDDGQAVTGLGIALAIEGDVDEAIQIVREASDRFSKDYRFAYNAACVYGRALERIPEGSDSEEQQQFRREYAEAALSRLEKSVELGFNELDLMKADPDLASLRNLERFQRLLRPEGDSQGPLKTNSSESSGAQKTFAKPKEKTGEP